jgi:predicted MFS family arabinose efflux permease
MALAAAVPSVLVLAASAFVFGLFVGPLTVRCFLDLERHAPPGSPAASVTVLIAAGLAATSVGSAIAGWTIDAGGTAPGLIIGAGCSLSTALLLLRMSAEQR